MGLESSWVREGTLFVVWSRKEVLAEDVAFELRDRSSKEVDKQKRQVEKFRVSGKVSAKALGQGMLSVTRNRQEATEGW